MTKQIVVALDGSFGRETAPSKSVPVDYLPGERVRIDDSEIIGWVTEASICLDRTVYQVKWMRNGSSHEAYFESFRLKATDA